MPPEARHPLPLALTMGDPAGIGMEIAVKAWARREREDVPPFALYADPRAVRDRAAALGAPVMVTEIDLPGAAAAAFARALPVVSVPLVEPAVPGRPSVANAAATIAAIDRAVSDVVAGWAAAVVTNPIAKSVLYGAGFRHPGHTEYLAHLAARLGGGPEAAPDPVPVMMLSGGGLNVVPLTIHVPLSDVPKLVTADLVMRTVRIVAAAMRRDFGLARPRIAVAGLNPHAGESGSIGREDVEIVGPAVAALAADGIAVTGPHSADTLFHAAARARYDVAIAMYHDQALIPVKTLAFDSGVNITLGLSFVRTSPDHGTAFDIAADFIASPDSLIAALRMADRMAAARRQAVG